MKVQFKHELRGKLGEQVYLISVSQLLLDPLPHSVAWIQVSVAAACKESCV